MTGRRDAGASARAERARPSSPAWLEAPAAVGWAARAQDVSSHTGADAAAKVCARAATKEAARPARASEARAPPARLVARSREEGGGLEIALLALRRSASLKAPRAA